MTVHDETYFEVECKIGEVRNYSFICPVGDEILISCNGSSLLGRQTCPQRSSELKCLSSSNSSCSLLDHTSSVSICICNLSSMEPDKDGSISFSIESMGESVLREFVSTWASVETLSRKKVLKSWKALLTVGVMTGSFILLMILGIIYDTREKNRIKLDIDRHVPSPRMRMTLLVPSDDAKQTVLDDRLNIIEESLPSIFKSNTLWCKFIEEMKVYHRWLGIVFYYSPEFPRSMRVLSLFSSIVIMLFIQSVTYNVADPDDGSCEACNDMKCCLSLKSTLNSNENRCYWQFADDNTSLSTNTCYLRDIGEDMTRMFIVALISTILTAPLALTVQYLIVNVLSKDVRPINKEQDQSPGLRRINSSWHSVGFSSFQTLQNPNLAEPSGNCLEEDLHNLTNELSMYYQYLLKEKPTKSKEFRGISSPSSSLINIR